MAEDTTAKLTIRLPFPVHAAIEKLAAAAHYEVGAYAQRVLTRHAIKKGALPAIEARKAELADSLIKEAVDEARRLYDSGGFDPHFTLNVFRRLARNPDWLGQYEELVGGDAYTDGLPGKFPINMYLGWYIKNAIKSEPEKTTTGKAKRIQVRGELIQSYTVLKRA